VGVRGEASLDGGGYRYGIYGYALGGEDGNYGVYGYASNNTGTKFGVFSSAVGAGTNYGVYGHVSGGTTNWAGYFSGNVNVTGSLSKGSGSFLIDHPLDPFNKTLRHNFVESPENLCLYRGKAKLDENGKAIIYMPDYFIALTKENEATIQLTPIAHRSIVTYEWNENFTAFVILGDANREVSYTVYADRDDPVMHQLYRPVEEEKGNGNFTKGKLLYPKAHGYPEEMGEDYQHRAENEKKSAN